MARRLLAEWKARGWPTEGVSVVVGVSGGADSVALLLALEELLRAGRMDLELTVAHINHGLRGASGEEDARWVESLAAERGLESVVGRADVKGRARRGRDNLEQAARRARYEFLEGVAREKDAWAVATAHTLDDQAETVMLSLLRGSGAEGLAGMRPERTLTEVGETKLVRPLVGWARRADTEAFCRELGVQFRSDEMNEDESFARVRVRRKLLPLLETFNPRMAETLARTSELLRDDAEALDALAVQLLEEACGGEESGAGTLRADVLAAAHVAVRRRALRRWIEGARGDLRRVEMTHILAVEKLLKGGRGGRVAELPCGGFVERRRGWLRFFRKSSKKGVPGERE